jgi:hypothetical protein
MNSMQQRDTFPTREESLDLSHLTRRDMYQHFQHDSHEHFAAHMSHVNS